MTPDQYCRQKAVAQSGSSLYYSLLFLPPARRRAITAVHAFRREIGDIVAECSDTGVARTKLAWWRLQIAAIDTGRPQHPVAQALVDATHAFDLPATDFHEIIDGLEAILTRRRCVDFESLRLTCHSVGGAIGRASARILGFTEPDTLQYAQTLGIACRLTGIIRDVGSDARRDRIYLPLDEIARYRVTVADILQARESDGFRQLMEFQIDRALRYYRDALALLPARDRNSQCAGRTMAAIHQALLHEIRTEGSRVLTQCTSLTPLRKLWIAWGIWVTK